MGATCQKGCQDGGCAQVEAQPALSEWSPDGRSAEAEPTANAGHGKILKTHAAVADDPREEGVRHRLSIGLPEQGPGPSYGYDSSLATTRQGSIPSPVVEGEPQQEPPTEKERGAATENTAAAAAAPAARYDAFATTTHTGREERVVRLDKDAAGCELLGLDTNARRTKTLGCALRIERMRPGGLIALWNSQHPKQLVKEGDHIVSVNGESKDHEAMYSLIQSSRILELKVVSQWP